MRLPDDDFLRLHRLAEFEVYYEALSTDEMVDEVDRIATDGDVKRSLFQHLTMHRRFVDIACFDVNLSETQRSAVIGIVTGLRDSIDRIILPSIEPDLAGRVRAALASSDDYADRFGYRVRDGLAIGGKPMWPGRENGCKCISLPVVKGFS